MSRINFISKDPINRGWSGDRKYCVTTADGVKYLLRISPEDRSTNCAALFSLLKEVETLGVSMCEPVEFGECEEGIYTLHSWIDDEDVEEIIPALAETEQYAYGFEAGRMLKLIHSIPAPENCPDWEPYFNAKMDNKIKMYKECPLKFEGAEYFIAYIESNRYLFANRPQSFQHGDYHIGNMMIEDKRLVIIDFDRWDYGDPWEEFNRIVWFAQVWPLFASGMVNAYFDNEVPLEFWKLLALYISSNMLSSIPWAISFGESEVNTMLKQAKDVLSWYKNMQDPVPIWYIK